MTKPSVNLCVIATDKYLGFLLPMLVSAHRYFLADFATTFHVWTDATVSLDHLFAPRLHVDSPDTRVICHRVRHEPWPYVSLHRFRTILGSEEELLRADFTFFADVDAHFVRPVGEDILSNLVAVKHCGTIGRPASELPFEQNQASSAWVPLELRRVYYAGGFQGGRTERWLQACREIDGRIRIDEANKVMAVAHDESHWNCYMAFQPPARSDCLHGAPLALSPDYCAHEGTTYSNQRTARFFSLDKNNKEFHGR